MGEVIDVQEGSLRGESFQAWLRLHGLQPDMTYEVLVQDKVVTAKQYVLDPDTGRKAITQTKGDVWVSEVFGIELYEEPGEIVPTTTTKTVEKITDPPARMDRIEVASQGLWQLAQSTAKMGVPAYSAADAIWDLRSQFLASSAFLKRGYYGRGGAAD